MPTHALVQVAEQREQSQLPRDVIVNTLCYRWSNFTIQSPESLANDVLDAYDAHFAGVNQGQYTAKVYDLEGTKPVLPMAEVVRHQGQIAPATSPREVALCLSFGGGQFQPRQRGRIYVYVGKITSQPGDRPSPAAQNMLIAFGQSLYDVGGANTDWIVWSRVRAAATGISRIWVDDEWDTVRSRGRRATSRLQHDF